MVTCLIIACVVLVVMLGVLFNFYAWWKKECKESWNCNFRKDDELKEYKSKLYKIKAEKMAGKFLETTVVFKAPDGSLQEESFDSDKFDTCSYSVVLQKNGEFVSTFYASNIIYIKRELKPIVKDDK